MTESIDQREAFALGVCYYPEHWPRDRWEPYARRMRDLGIAYVRIAEFAWSRLEPRPGQFDWGWLDDAIAVLHAEGLKVVLCTPTATPPAWLIHAHPEILPIDADGRVRNFGSRRHYDPGSEVYRAEARRITTALAGRYGQHPAVVGWQTDNEFGCHDTTGAYSDESRTGFQAWLREFYENDLAALNHAWGAVFWSQEYTAWEQIGLPHNVPAELNPSHLLDFYRYRSDVAVSFQEVQVEILRRLSPGRWVTHNFMQLFGDFDQYDAAECLDFVTWDSYPCGSVERTWLSPEEKTRWARTGEPDLIAINHDIYRGLKGDGRGIWVMEQGAGQVNWAPYNALPARGATALWTAQGYAHGCDVITYFRWRAATVAQELMHSGLLRHDETLDRGGEEVAALELPARPNAPIEARVVLLHDYESLWIYDAQPHNADASYWRQTLLFYSALRSLGVDVDVRHPDHDLAGYDLIVAPAIQLVGEDRAGYLQDAAQDALFLAGPRFAYRTPSGRVHEDGQPGPLTELLGCTLQNFDSMRPGLDCTIAPSPIATGEGGRGVRATIWAESYRLLGGEATHRYADGPMEGEAAVVRHGNAVTIGAWSPDLIREVLAGLLAERGIPHESLPEGVRVARRGDLATWMNFNQEPATLPDGSVLAPVAFEQRRA